VFGRGLLPLRALIVIANAEGQGQRLEGIAKTVRDTDVQPQEGARLQRILRMKG
jgi:hypothetical protein